MSTAGTAAAPDRQPQRAVIRRPLLWIGLAALGFRLAAVVAVMDWQQPPSDFSLRYLPIANAILDGEGFAMNGLPTAVAPPLYPLLLAAVLAVFGPSVTAVRIVLALVDTAHCLVWAVIAGRLLGERIGWSVGALLAVCPYLVYLVVTAAGSDTLFLLLQGAFVLLFVGAVEGSNGGHRGRFLGAGAVLGLATLCRALSLLLPLAVVPIILVRGRRRPAAAVMSAVLLVAGFTLVLSPWTARNWQHFHRLVPVQTLGGYHLYLAVAGASSDEKSAAAGDVATDADYLHRGLREMAAQPLFVLREMASRLWRMWFWTHSGRLPGLLATVNLVLLAAALGGIVLTRRRWRQLLVLYVVIGYYIALHSVLYAIFRYLMPVVPALITFAAAAGWGVVDRLRRRQVEMGG